MPKWEYRVERIGETGASVQLGKMVDEINAIPGVKASADVTIGQEQES